MVSDLTSSCVIATSRSKTVNPLRLGLKFGIPQELIPLDPAPYIGTPATLDYLARDKTWLCISCRRSRLYKASCRLSSEGSAEGVAAQGTTLKGLGGRG